MRKCKVCHAVKDPSEFYSNRADCIPCQKALDAKRPHRSGIRRNDTDAARARKRRWQALNRDPLKESARRKVRAAVKSGVLVRRRDCEVCGQSAVRKDGHTAVQAHHDDYTKPLSVRWLCVKCHGAWHRINDDAARDASTLEGQKT